MDSGPLKRSEMILFNLIDVLILQYSKFFIQKFGKNDQTDGCDMLYLKRIIIMRYRYFTLLFIWDSFALILVIRTNLITLNYVIISLFLKHPLILK